MINKERVKKYQAKSGIISLWWWGGGGGVEGGPKIKVAQNVLKHIPVLKSEKNLSVTSNQANK